jgi:hypothetical protein
MAQPVVHFEITGADSARTKEFYANLFAWEINTHEEMNYHLVAPSGNNSIGGGLSAVPPGMKPYVTIYIQVDDPQAYLDKAEKLGGKTIMPPTPIPGVGTTAWLADPDDNNIGLFKPGA